LEIPNAATVLEGVQQLESSQPSTEVRLAKDIE
jgi:hypothetical protein